MPLISGVRLGAYEIVALIGAGGMGEVYRATDTRLNRDVAIKVLPEAFAQDKERLARFEREAQLLAQLHHPHIASVFGLEEPAAGAGEARGARALIMEFVEGDDLATRLASGRLAVDEALPIARQIAEALEAAHDLGIVHRDLKPANVKVKADGTVKVLDFGLARAVDPGGASNPGGPLPSPTLMNSPTLTAAHATRLGVILGTAAYMSPEQARGRPVDKRADIWAFGVVLYEMLTGRRLFVGDDISDVLAAVLRQEIDFTALPADTPEGVQRLLGRCLERDPRQRLRDIGEARVALATASEPAAALSVSGSVATATGPSRVTWRAWLPWSIAAAAIALATWAYVGRPAAVVPAAPVEGHFTIGLPDSAPLVTVEVPGGSDGPLVVSQDGRHVVYVAANGSGRQLYVRAIGDLTPRALPGTDGARAPFFSPDGQWVGFFAGGRLKKTPLAGGTPTTLGDAYYARGGAWGTHGEIVYSTSMLSGLFSISDAGGTPRAVTTIDHLAGDDAHGWPQWLPDGRTLLFTVFAWVRETSEIVAVDLETGARRLVMRNALFARYVPAASGAATGHVVFVRNGTLVAAPFDPRGTGPAGEPVAVVEGVRQGQFDISASGRLVYVPESGEALEYSLAWVDRSGEARAFTEQKRGYEDLHLSPDGRRLAVTIEESGANYPAHVWLADAARGTATRITFEGFSRDPVWAPDGASVIFGSKRGESTYGLYRQRVDGRSAAELIWASPTPLWPDPQSVTPDAKTVTFNTKGQGTGDDIWVLSLEAGHAARPIVQSAANEWAGRVSPDGRWLAFNSDESGRVDVYVQPFPGPGSKRLVSRDGGFNPIWSRDGRELFYRDGDRVLAVDVETTSEFAVGNPVVLFAGRYRDTGRDFDVSPDGTRFVMMRAETPRTTARMNVVLDWWQAFRT